MMHFYLELKTAENPWKKLLNKFWYKCGVLETVNRLKLNTENQIKNIKQEKIRYI